MFKISRLSKFRYRLVLEERYNKTQSLFKKCKSPLFRQSSSFSPYVQLFIDDFPKLRVETIHQTRAQISDSNSTPFSHGSPLCTITYPSFIFRRTFSDKPSAKTGAPRTPPKTSNTTLAVYLVAFIMLMLGLSYAAVPLYQMFCQVTGLGGTTQVAEKGKAMKVDKNREVTIRFTANVARTLPWKFSPMQSFVDVHPGQPALAFYEVTNISDEPLIGVATYTVDPPEVGKYFEKIECFCFDEQRINPHETVFMPVLFRLDTDFSKSSEYLLGRRSK